ncbi:hypothetical protein B7988_08490 [Fibrobacter sp. UWB1]|nr:hypothetical protein B7988_08490 [Fibrobacter sp. UWB1]
MRNCLLVLFFITSLMYANPELYIGGKKIDMSKDLDLKKVVLAIDDSLHKRWIGGQFVFPELIGLCGCACDDGISVKSGYDIGDSVWLFNPCGNQDSSVTIADNDAYGPAYTLLQENSKLWLMVKDFKNRVRTLK